MTTAQELLLGIIREHIDVNMYESLLGAGYDLSFDPGLIDALAAAGFGDLARAWEEGARKGWQASAEGWNGEYPDEGKEWHESEGFADLSPLNPYRAPSGPRA